MQAYAEGWELLEKVDDLDNVPEVFESWRDGTVIRSWLLDLLVAALEDDDQLDEIRGLRRGLRRGPLDRRGGDRPRRAAAVDHRLALRPVRLPAGRLAGDEGDRGAAQPVRRPRRAAPEVPARGDALRRRREASLTVHVSHLSLADFRSYADG